MASTRRRPSFGELLRHYRLAADLTQEALAERAGASVRGVPKLEAGESRLYRETAVRLAAALELIGEEYSAFVEVAQPALRTGRSHGAIHLLPDVTGRVRNLPIALTSFVGREREVEQVRGLLAALRLVNIFGPPGTGTTRLALEVAAIAADEFVEGIFGDITASRRGRPPRPAFNG